MSEFVRGLGGMRRPAVRPPASGGRWDAAAGRHAFDEEAALTPIFHALTVGGWRSRQHEQRVAEIDEFRRDPLTAPIPVLTADVVAAEALRPVPAPAVSRSGAHALVEPRRDGGRHHRRLEPVGAANRW